MKPINSQPIPYAGLASKRVFVFDWDGTLLDSMPIKSQNFVKAFGMAISEEDIPDLADKVAELYLKLSGRPRKDIFLEILRIFHLEEKNGAYGFFNNAFEAINRRTLIRASIFTDALALLNELIGSNRQIFISSSVPQHELSDLVNAILPRAILPRIGAVLGSEEGFSKGENHLRWIMQKTNTTTHELLVIGDDVADYDLSAVAGVDCVLVNRRGVRFEERIDVVSDLCQIRDILRNEVQSAG